VAWARAGARGGPRGSCAARAREGGLGPESAHGGERNSLLFLFFYNLLFPLNKYLSTFLGCQNILSEVLLTTIMYAYDE
jgi:hypothetical protein